MSDTITVTRQQWEDARAQFALLTAFKDGERSPGMGQTLSYTGRKQKAFATPEAAAAQVRALSDGMSEKDAHSLVRAMLGGEVRRDWTQIFATQPTVNSVHIDVGLTDISVRYSNTEYIGPLVAPRVQIGNRTNKFWTYGTENLRNDAQVRAPGASAPRSGYTQSTGSIAVETYSMEHAVPDELRANADSPLDPDRDGTMFATDVIDLKLEKQVAALVNTSANWTTNVTLSGTQQWSDYTNSDPFSDIKTARLTVRKQVARRPNTGVLGVETFEALALHPDLLDRVKYTGSQDRPAMVTAQMMAEMFQLDQVLVGAAVENTANEGATDVIGFVWGKHAWIGFVADAPALMTPSAAYVFTNGRMADRYRENQTKSDIIRVEEAWDTRVVVAGAGYRIVNASA